MWPSVWLAGSKDGRKRTDDYFLLLISLISLKLFSSESFDVWDIREGVAWSMTADQLSNLLPVFEPMRAQEAALWRRNASNCKNTQPAVHPAAGILGTASWWKLRHDGFRNRRVFLLFCPPSFIHWAGQNNRNISERIQHKLQEGGCCA